MRFKNFLDKFPPPKFLNVPYSAVVFSDSNIRVLTLERATMHPKLYLELPLEEGAIEGGKIQKEKAVSEVLKSFVKDLKTPFVKFGFPDEISYVFSAEIPVLAEKDASEAVSFLLEENVPLPLADISFDFTATKIKKMGSEFTADVVVTAASSSIIEGYIKVLKQEGLEPLLAVNESQSIAKSIIHAGESSNFAIIYSHRNIVGIYMTEGQLVEFSSIIQIPPNSSLELATSFVIAEFKKALDYWKDRKSPKTSGEVKCFLCGKYDMCESVLQSMQKISLAPASLANVWINAFSLEDYIPEISFEDSLRVGGAVGLFLT